MKARMGNMMMMETTIGCFVAARYSGEMGTPSQFTGYGGPVAAIIATKALVVIGGRIVVKHELCAGSK